MKKKKKKLLKRLSCFGCELKTNLSYEYTYFRGLVFSMN